MITKFIIFVIAVLIITSVFFLWYKIIKSVLDQEEKYHEQKLDEIKKKYCGDNKTSS